MVLAFCLTVVIMLLLLAAATDLAIRMVPNRICLALALFGIAISLDTDPTLQLLAFSILASFAVFVLAAIGWRHGIMGGGDVKLLAAATLLVRPAAVPDLVLSVTIIGGLQGAIYWLLGRHLSAGSAGKSKLLLRRISRIERHRIRRQFSLPYAIAISGGSIYALARGYIP